MSEFLDYNFSVPRRSRQNVGRGGYTKWRGGDGAAGETYVKVSTAGHGTSSYGEYPFVNFVTGQVEPSGDTGIVLYGNSETTGNGPNSSFQIWGATAEGVGNAYRMRQYMTVWDDHPTQTDKMLVGLGIIDYTDLIANPTTGASAYEAGIVMEKYSGIQGWLSHYGSNHHFYNNPDVVAGVYGAFVKNLSIYGPPTNRVDMDNDCWVHGSLSKGSGSFDIEHPVVEGKRLRHSFIEGPQADLIYRGTTELGAAPTVINMDTEFNMTPGTWEALNCTPWSIVSASGKVVEWGFEGSTLTITGDEGTTCMWMVIGERHDPHMKNDACSMADGHGRVIVEYDQPEPIEDPPPNVPEHESDPFN
jgi:hypothetical protein